MVGEGDGRLAKCLRARHDAWNASESIQERELGMHVKVHEVRSTSFGQVGSGRDAVWTKGHGSLTLQMVRAGLRPALV